MSEDDLQEQEAPVFEDDSSDDDVAEAKSMGWKDPKEWKGDPPKGGFQKAKDFVERGRTFVPIAQSLLKREKEENAKLRDQIDKIQRDSEERFASLERMNRAALKQQRSQLKAKYDELKENAVETGDKEQYRKIDKEQREALKEFDEGVEEKKDIEAKQKKAADDLPISMRETIDKWVAENSAWFDVDDEMTALANTHHKKLLKEKPGFTLTENLAAVRAYVAKRFPEKFGPDEGETEDDTPRGSRVEGGSRVAGGGGKTAWSKLPKDAQAQADRFIKEEGLYIGPTFGGSKDETVENSLQKARERYATFYLENEK